MEAAGLGLRLAASAFTPLVKRLFRQEGAGAGLVDRPVRISALVSFRGEQRKLAERDLRKLSAEVARQAVRALGPHDAPSPDTVIRATDLLTRSLLQLGELDMDDIQAVRLGHEILAHELILPADGPVADDAYLLYERLLNSACLHVLNFFTQRSTFVARTLVEQSSQLDRLVRVTDLLAERLPHQPSEDATFERRYGRYVTQEYGRLAIYGLDLQQSREWPLDDAYLSLEARPTAAAAEGREEAAPLRAERALSGVSRVLLRGHAGSGKTTLVQWLAVTAARQDPEEGLLHLLGRVPFVLTMRTLTRDRRALPDPGGFLAAVDCPLAGAQPERWADRVLAAGRGLLLVDGIDEIPEDEREPVRRWLRRLHATYPDNLWLVTARPSAVREDWLYTADFHELVLAPMRQADVRAFVQRWHRAVGGTAADAAALLDLVHARQDLAALATNPLMCALICALHRERNGHLPRGRKALYDAALSMLLERRDRERPDPPRGALVLDADTQISLLQKLAYWLITNGRSELSTSLAASLLANALPVIHRGDELGPAPEVLRHLVERSGLLREPSDGALDFVHRTFQDYLGAREIVDWQHFPALVAKAHEDQWEDVVRMAVAHAQPVQRGELLSALVARGDSDDEHRVRLHLLAMACLEHATQLQPTVRAEVIERARRFVPPRVRDESRVLADVGSVAMDLLPGPEGLTEEEADAVVFALTRTPTDGALVKLRAFRDHRAPFVQHLLTAHWHRFDTDRYFDEIVAHLPHADGQVFPAHTLAELHHLRSLSRLSGLDLRGDFAEADIVAFLTGRPITTFRLRDCDTITDIAFLNGSDRIASLLLDNCPRIADLSPLADGPLRELSLYSDTVRPLPRGLGELNGLDELTIGSLYELDSLDRLPRHAPLTSLTLPSELPGLTGLRAWPGLVRLALHFAERPLTAAEGRTLAGLTELTHLTTHVEAVRGLARTGTVLPQVTFVQLFPYDRVEPFTPDMLHDVVLVFPGLETLIVNNDATDFLPLEGLPGLRSLHVLSPSTAHGVPEHVEIAAPEARRY
ncbi:NACHT domain-containing protein [Streptomyces johnsoniae]|uniref:NACHT domain-containing protein n=1 Tax=Streptomyces johnsoniae TaxID=3075532 RepID=A0ABU2SD38_9ACTN|nr:NACHT domain-containing protein [Streptomyces sp. DSM 41886]MDT0446904.1 NACHT domain-containing protein [Streptomyces sp. DSM 41886]